MMPENHYPKFALSLFLSFLIMYGVMFLNVAEWGDIYVSMTRLYMTLLMVSPMAVIMLLVMKKMYSHKRLNKAIITGSVIVFAAALICLRTQAFIGDSQYMKAMIPHHSSAIMTSSHAKLREPGVRALADRIILSQRREIREMKAALDSLGTK